MGARISGPTGGGGGTIAQNADINVTPFVDIMLVLLIIFMVAAPLATVSLKLDMPPADFPPDAASREPVYITVQNSGEIYIADKRTSLATISTDVCAALGGDRCREQRIFVRAQPEVSYARFMSVMDRLYADGFTQVGLLNEDIE